MGDFTKGLRLSVYRTTLLGDCTLGGLTARHDEVTIVGVFDEADRDAGIVPLEGLLAPHAVTVTAPAVVLVKRHVNKLGLTLHLAPLETVQAGRRGMAGGNYAATTDSRMTALVGGMYGALPVHDRFER